MVENVDVESPLVSIIITNWNGKSFLEKCLKSVLDTDYPRFEVIFVDNCSTDGSFEFVKSLFGNYACLKMFQTERNIGWPAATNRGIRTSNGEIVVHLSPDTEVDPSWLKGILKVMLSDQRIGVAQCKTLLMRDRKTIDSARNFIDPFGFLYSLVPHDIPEEVFFAEGMAIAVRRVVFGEIGLFDKDFFTQYDDVDFCWRARLAGWRVVFVPYSIVYHVRGGTSGGSIIKTKPLYAFRNCRNQITTLLKNYRYRNIIKYVPCLILLQLGKSFLYLFAYKDRPGALAIVQAILSLPIDFRNTWRKRLEVQRYTRRVADAEIMKFMIAFNPSALSWVFRTRAPLASLVKAK
jgi:hypothetical protein